MNESYGVRRVIDDPLKFKSKLGIGKKSFALLRAKKLVGVGLKILEGVGRVQWLGGGFIAILGALGFVAAAAPGVAWLIAAYVAAAAVEFGGREFVRDDREERVDVVQELIETPLDALAIALFKFIALLGLKVAAIDEKVTNREQQYIENYFVDEWGYSKEFVQLTLRKLECNIESTSIVELIDGVIEFKIGNVGPNFELMSKDLTHFLMEVTRADGQLHNREVIFIQWLEITLKRRRPG